MGLFITYIKKEQENILPKYKITQDNPVDNILRFTRRNSDLKINPNDLIDYDSLGSLKFSGDVTNMKIKIDIRQILYRFGKNNNRNITLLIDFYKFYFPFTVKKSNEFNVLMDVYFNNNKSLKIVNGLYKNNFIKTYIEKFNFIYNFLDSENFLFNSDLNYFHNNFIENRFYDNQKILGYMQDIFLSGYELKNNFDSYGKFYIVHFYENMIERSIKRNIIKLKINEKEIKTDKIDNKYFDIIYARNIKGRLSVVEINNQYYKTQLYKK